MAVWPILLSVCLAIWSNGETHSNCAKDRNTKGTCFSWSILKRGCMAGQELRNNRASWFFLVTGGMLQRFLDQANFQAWHCWGLLDLCELRDAIKKTRISLKHFSFSNHSKWWQCSKWGGLTSGLDSCNPCSNPANTWLWFGRLATSSQLQWSQHRSICSLHGQLWTSKEGGEAMRWSQMAISWDTETLRNSMMTLLQLRLCDMLYNCVA